MWKCMARSTQPPKVTEVQALNRCDTGWQVAQGGGEERQWRWCWEPPRRTSGSQLLRTVFVRHGQAVADCQWRERRRALYL
jgi:hypothetical protein